MYFLLLRIMVNNDLNSLRFKLLKQQFDRKEQN